MRLKSVDGIKPSNDGVVVKLVDTVNLSDNEVYLGGDEDANKQDIKMYYGEVEHLGPTSTDPENCPNLEKGDISIFSQFAGHHIATDDGESHKLIRGYDIMAVTTNPADITVDNTKPKANRLMVEVIFVDVDEDGIALSDDESKDPRLADVDYGKVVSIADSCKLGYKVGDIVGYSPYVGEVLRHQGDIDTPCLKVMVEDDVLYTVE